MCCEDKNFYDSVSSCVSSIKVYAIFEPNAEYIWVITDPFGNVYEQPFTADIKGYGSIDTSKLPEGFCNPFMPSFMLQVRTLNDFTPKSLIFPVAFESAIVKISGGNRIKASIGNKLQVEVAVSVIPSDDDGLIENDDNNQTPTN